MAKDGTNRGGARVGAGRKTKALNDKIREGRSDSAMVLPEPASFNGEDVPPVKEYLRAQQKNGKSLAAAEIFEEVWLWLKQRGCDGLVSTTGNAIASPYVSMSSQYMKQSNQIWYQIYQVVKENCSTPYSGTPHDDMMERLLQSRKGL